MLPSRQLPRLTRRDLGAAIAQRLAITAVLGTLWLIVTAPLWR
jgi:hypothetical protein